MWGGDFFLWAFYVLLWYTCFVIAGGFGSDWGGDFDYGEAEVEWC